LFVPNPNMATTSSPTTTDHVSHPSTHRLSKWLAVVAFSTIALVSLLGEMGSVPAQSRQSQWAVGAISSIVGLSGIAFIVNVLAKEKFAGKLSELGMAVMVFGLWAAVMPAIMRPSSNLAVNDSFGIYNANLYFFSWAGIISSLILLNTCVRQTYNPGPDKNSIYQSGMWVGLCLSSFVVLINASREFRSTTCNSSQVRLCRRLKFAIAIGCFTAAVSIFMTVAGKCVPGIVDASMALVLLITWILGFIFITFGGSNAPAEVIGNLYFSTWTCFILTIFLTAAGWNLLFGKKNETNQELSDHGGKKAEVTHNEGDIENVDPTTGVNTTGATTTDVHA
jgi:hypothetical protein